MTRAEGPHLARRLWTLYEPLHAVVYFHPIALARLERAGLRGFWRGYFAQRAAPLGAVGEAPVRAAFFSFAPAMTARALPAVWALATPADALEARLDGAGATLRELLAGVPELAERDVERIADDLWAIAANLPCDGRVLAAANVAQPRPDDALQRLWQATASLREHRGDGHVTALVTAGLTGVEALVLRAASDLDRDLLQKARGWTDAEWDVATTALLGRGLLEGPGEISARGRHTLDLVEGRTDILAWEGWTRAGGTEADARRLMHRLHRGALACRATMPQVNPIGLPEPPPDPDPVPGSI